MRTHPRVLVGALVAGLTVSLAACGATSSDGAGATPAAEVGSTTAPGADASGTSEPSEGAGAYVSLADYEADRAAYAGTTVVLFFHASWCPSCRATEKAVQESGVPAGLTLVKVDYDTEDDLRRTYGVTQQHTFVQVDDAGAALGKWSGSTDGADILAQTV